MSSFSQSTSWPPVGRRVGRYVLFEEFARGGMASLHFGRLLGEGGFSRVVAVKQVRAIFSGSEEHRRAILAEARLASRIRHPNVVQTLDIVIDAGVVYVVMEYVHGATAAELFAEARLLGERVPVTIAAGVVSDALQGLHAAHEAKDANGGPLGIVHRDVSPQNIHVGVDGHARLLDFGIAKALDRTQVTAPGVVKGKIAYMAREQLGGALATRQVDVYAAGVVLWELLTGRRLFDEGDPALLASRVLTETAPPPSDEVPDVSAALDQVVLRATAPDPRQRYENVAEMLAALAAATTRAEPSEISAWVERLAADALELRAEGMTRAETARVSDLRAPAAPDARPRRRIAAAATAAGLCALVAYGAFAAARPRPTPPQAVLAATSSPSSPPPPPPPPPLPSPSPPPPPPSSFSPPPAPSSPPKHRPAGSCDPPFRIDTHGTKLYKQECLR